MSKKRLKRFFQNNTILFIGGAGILLASFLIIWVASIKIPDFKAFEDRKVASSTKIYDRTGAVLLYDIHDDVKRTNISFDSMGPNIKNATVAVEDASFWNNSGIKITSIIRAAIADVFRLGRTQGGSTITQQLVKNTLLTSDKSLIRKIKEWILAIKVDRSMSKEKILEAYLNEAPYGGTIYGIQEASQTYFGKNAQDLSIAEAAYLAAIPQSPTALSPYGKNKARLEQRKNFVLSRMLDTKFITKEEYDQVRAETPTFMPQATTGIRAPHFVFFIKEYLQEKYGTDRITNGGLRVVTTLNYELEQKAEQIVKDGALQNEKDWNGSNASLVAIDPKTGQILSMVGSRDYFDKNIDGNFNVATAVRQPGSSFKPFIYATAFGKGFTPDTVLFDLPTEFQTTCNAYGKALPGHNQKDCYMPDNYDGKFRGPMSLRDALAQSINVIAVKLFYLAGLSDSLKTAEDMGISSLSDPSRYGLTLVIGGGEVSLLDMTSAYSVFANSGVRNPYTGILQITDSTGNVLEQYSPDPRPVLAKNTALTVSDVLDDNAARVPTFGAHSQLEIPGRQVAAKTGTTNNNKDAWTIGYTPSVAVGVWAGNNDNKPMKKGGVAVAGPIWNKFILEALKILPNERFEKPNLDIDPTTTKPALLGFWQGNDSFFIDNISGGLATEFTPKETRVEKVITNIHSILYWVDRKNITGAAPTNPANDPQWSHWETPIQDWWAANAYKYRVTTAASKPGFYDNIHTANSKPVVSISVPDTYTVYPANEKLYLTLTPGSISPIQKVDVFVNDIYLGTSKSLSGFSFIPSQLDNLRDVNTLKILVYDAAYNNTEVNSTFRVR